LPRGTDAILERTCDGVTDVLVEPRVGLTALRRGDRVSRLRDRRRVGRVGAVGLAGIGGVRVTPGLARAVVSTRGEGKEQESRQDGGEGGQLLDHGGRSLSRLSRDGKGRVEFGQTMTHHHFSEPNPSVVEDALLFFSHTIM